MKVLAIVVIIVVVTASRAKADLLATVSVSPGPTTWSYLISNDEPGNSSNFISSFTLSVNAPVTVIGTPTGWDFSTDGSTFVSWFNLDASLPYPHDVAPGKSLGGFSLTSTGLFSDLLGYGLTGWDHSLDQPGPDAVGVVLSPSVSPPVSSVPEPSFASIVTILAALVILFRSSQKSHYDHL
jgi:hypothetical protein